MTRNEALARLRADKPELERFGVKTIALFGSMARDEARPESDIDILVDYRAEAMPGLFEFVGLKQHQEDMFGRKVDLLTPGGLHHRLRDRILREAVYA